MIYNLPRKRAKFEETWVIEQSPELVDSSIEMEIPFESNSTNFQKFEMRGSMFPGSGIYYDAIKVWDTSVWINEAYRTITFFEPPTGDLLKWLQANAVKQGSDTPVDTSSWSVSDISGATYKFALNSNGYYESNNKGVNNSAAVCRVKIHAAKACTVTFKCINYAESNYDYGLLGVIDKEQSTGYSDTSTNVQKSFKGSSTASVQTYEYTNVAKGDHFIDVKYRKDSSQSSNNDSLQFTVEITED